MRRLGNKLPDIGLDIRAQRGNLFYIGENE